MIISTSICEESKVTIEKSEVIFLYVTSQSNRVTWFESFLRQENGLFHGN